MVWWVAGIQGPPPEPNMATKARNWMAPKKIRAEGKFPSSRALSMRRNVGCSVFWSLSAILANQQSLRRGESHAHVTPHDRRQKYQDPPEDRQCQHHLDRKRNGE